MMMLSRDSMPGCKRARESWHHNDSGGACKLARYGADTDRSTAMMQKLPTTISPPESKLSSKICTERIDKGTGEVEKKSIGEVGSIAPSCKEIKQRQDPLEVVGGDMFQTQILPRLDSRSLARSAAVCSRWRPLALADSLWQPLVKSFFEQRAHLPLCLMGQKLTMKQHLLYTIAMSESRQEALVAAEMCARTWELRLKPACGPYWLGFDPTQVGKPGLNRYFSCDGRLNSDPGDPIWGGHACVWEFIRREGEGTPTELVRINHWPPLSPRRVKDGRWVLENFFGLYITRPDNPAFSNSASSDECSSARRRWCRNACSPPINGSLQT